MNKVNKVACFLKDILPFVVQTKLFMVRQNGGVHGREKTVRNRSDGGKTAERQKRPRRGKSREKAAGSTAERQSGWQRTEAREKRQEGREVAGQTWSNPEAQAGP